MIKRILIAIFAVLISAQMAFAAWSVNSSLTTYKAFGDMKIVTIAVVSDGAAQSTPLNLFPLLPSNVAKFFQMGLFVYSVSTAPDSTTPPTADYDITLIDAVGSTLALDTQDHTAASLAVSGDSTDTGLYLITAGYLGFTCTDTGNSGETVIITIIIL